MQEIFSQLPVLLKMSGEASVLILLVLAVQWLCGPRLKPRWRCALWLLVVLRLALPWSIPSPASVFNLFKISAASPLAQPETILLQTMNVPAPDAPVNPVAASMAHNDWLAWLWVAGVLFLTGCTVLNQYKFHRRIGRLRPLTESATLNLFEDCKALMGVHTPVTLVETDVVKSPALFGFVRPRLLLPSGLVSRFTPEELRHVFLHELAHIKRFDILVGWMALGLQIIHWFNPLVWLAFYRLRVDRELACDALVLARARTGENESYGLTIVKLLESLGQPVWTPGLAGILENKQQIKGRIRMIAKFHKRDRGLVLAVALLAGLTLLTMTDACRQKHTTHVAPGQMPAPQIVATTPSIGATDVDPATTEITVTFDHDMGGGMSWTGGGSEYPNSPAGQQAHWRDKRTCVLPVKLEAGHYYRVGINSQSYRNFATDQGAAAVPSAIYFTTRGATPDTIARTLAPQAVTFDPPNGAQAVSASVKEVRVTFNVPMGDGCSWCTASDLGTDFPKGVPGKDVYWTDDRKTCVLPVTLKPGKTYRLSLNDPDYKNFQNDAGVPLEPVAYTFTTSATP
jgi:beta-lactamase regulating signal transducer with metallopeptidase domain